MKKIFLAEFLRQIQTKPNFKKKLKIFAGLGVVGLLLASTLAIYLGVVGVKYIAGLGTNVDVARHAETLRSKAENLPSIAGVECLGTVQSLLNLEKLLSTPIKDNFQTLKKACFEETVKPSDTGKESEMI